jgi:hypothetical protein
LSGTLQLIIRGRVQHKHVFVPRWPSNSSRFDPGQMNGEEGRRPAPGGRGRSGWAAARGCAGRWPGCGACPWLGVAARGRCGPPPGFLRGRIYFRQGWGWGEGRRRRRRGAVEPWVEERARWHQRTGRARREEVLSPEDPHGQHMCVSLVACARSGVAWRAACGCAATTCRGLRPGGYCGKKP